MRTLAMTALLGLALSAATAAQDLIVVHAINGLNIDQAEDLLVDIELNGTGALEDVPYTASALVPDVGPGDHTVVVRLSDGIENSFTGTVVLDTRVNVAAFETAAVVAYLDANRTISLDKFTVKGGALGLDDSRITVLHTAVAPTVDILAKTRGASARLYGLSNGDQSASLDVPTGDYQFRIRSSFGKSVNVTLDGVGIDGNLLLVAAGAVDDGTFTVFPVAVDG